MRTVGRTIVSNRGFSLAEMIVAVFLFMVLAAGIYTTGVVSERFWQASKVKVQLQQDVRKGMEWMIRDLREAGDTSITDVPADGTWYDLITFKVPTGVNGNGITVWGDEIVFALGGSGTDLERTQSGVSKIIAQNIQSVQFRRLSTNSDMLEVSLSAQKTTLAGEAINDQLDFEVQLRN